MNHKDRSVLSAGMWYRGLATGLIAGLQLVQLWFLAHWLPPKAFGVYAILRTITGLGGYFSDAGMYNAILYGRPLKKALFSTLYWMSIGVGLLMFGGLAAIAPWFAGFYKMEALRSAIKYTGLALFFMAMGGHFKSVLQKDLKFKKLAIIDVFAHVLGVLTAIIYAFYYKDVMALVFGYLVRVFVASSGYIIAGYKKHPVGVQLSSEGLKYYLRYAAFQLPERWLGYLNANMDVLIVGRIMGSEILGVYELFKQFLRRGIHIVNPLLDHVFVPLMTAQHRLGKDVGVLYLRMIQWSTLVLFPLYIVLMVESESFILYFFGKTWSPYGQLFQWLCLYFMVHSVVQHIGAWWVATNRPDQGFYWNLGLLPVMFITVYLGVKQSVELLTILLTVLMLFQGILLYLTMLSSTISSKEYLKAFGLPLVYSVLSFSVLFVMKWYPAVAGLINIPVFITGIIIYVLLVRHSIVFAGLPRKL